MQKEDLALDQNDLLVHLVAFHYWDAIPLSEAVTCLGSIMKYGSSSMCTSALTSFLWAELTGCLDPGSMRCGERKIHIQEHIGVTSQRWLCVHACVFVSVCMSIWVWLYVSVLCVYEFGESPPFLPKSGVTYLSPPVTETYDEQWSIRCGWQFTSLQPMKSFQISHQCTC